MSRRVEEALGQLDELLVAHLLDEVVDSHGVDQLAVGDCCAVLERNELLLGVDLDDLPVLAVALVRVR